MTSETQETSAKATGEALLPAAHGSTATDTDPMRSELKMAINNLIWMNAPETLTIGDADAMSNAILVMIITGKQKP